MKNWFVIFIFLLSFFNGNAQNGTLSGVVKDGEFNDVLPFANVSLKNSEKGTTTDFEGVYELSVQEGTYVVVFSFMGYENLEVTEVIIKENEVTTLNVTIQAQAAQLKEVVITASQAKNTEASVLHIQKSSVKIMDGLSAQSMKKMGSSNLVSAVKSVPGVSVQGGKYVYVRGLGDRYTKSILNGVDIPGLDPDKNTIQMDIFPTNILDNIQILKSATADLPADFTGGVVNIITKDIPVRKQLTITLSGGYNPDMHFNTNYLDYRGSSTDFLGFDNGVRALPFPATTTIPNPAANNNTLLEGYTRDFTPTLAAQTTKSLMDFGFGFNYGNQFTLGTRKLGLVSTFNYKNETDFYSGFKNGTYLKPEENDEFELRSDRTQIGDLGKNNVLLSGLVGFSFKTDKSKYKFNIVHIQNGESRAAFFNQETDISNVINVTKDNLEYTQRAVSNLLLTGKHVSEDASFTTEWKVSPSLAKNQDKDVRITTFIYDEDTETYSISSDASFPTRIWRDLEEINNVSKIDFTKKYKLFAKDAKVKFGGLHTYKNRQFGISNFDFSFRAVDPRDLNGDPDAILSPENIWTPETNQGYYVRGNFEPANTYDSSQNIGALYVSNEFKLSENFKSILGLRAEHFSMNFTGQNNSGSLVYTNQEVISTFDLFPSANLIYTLKDNTNIRMSYSRTTARPSFKEVSVVQITDVLTGILFIGNIHLKPSYIHNLDTRFEIYGKKSELVALSGFYKSFKDPIELVAYKPNTPNEFQPRNAPEAAVYGIEFEARKNLGFINTSLEKLSFNVNASYIKSAIKMDKTPGQEYESRQLNARVGETIRDTRELQGQSPYLINAGLSYANTAKAINSGVFYNVQGKTLQVVGINTNPDVFTLPFNNLDFNFSKSFGIDLKNTITFKANNLLDASRKSVYQSFGAADQIFKERKPKRAFSLSYSYKF